MFSSKASILAWVCSILFLSFCTSSLARWLRWKFFPSLVTVFSASLKPCLSSLVDLLSSAMISSAFGPRAFLNLSVKDLSMSELSFLKMLDSPPFPQTKLFSFISYFAKPDWAKFGDIDFRKSFSSFEKNISPLQNTFLASNSMSPRQMQFTIV